MARDKTSGPEDAAAARQERLAAALRENLRRRKAQERARDEVGESLPAATSPPSTTRQG